MDSVPSPSVSNPSVASPHISIYDQDKPDRWSGCYTSTTIQPSNPCSESSVSDEVYVLDDKLEDSTLQNMLTSEVMSSLRASSSAIATDFQWGGKPFSSSSPAVSSSQVVVSTPTLAELNMGVDTDLSLVSDLLNLDSGETSLDFLGTSSKAYRTLTPAKCNIYTDISHSYIKKESGHDADTPQVSNTTIMDISGSNYIKNYTPFVDNFPPRSSHPPVVGVVAPVKKEKGPVTESSVPKFNNVDKSQSSCLHSLLKQPSGSVKSEYERLSRCANEGSVSKTDLSAQIVPPSHSAVKRNFNDSFKAEPTSPIPSAPLAVSEESLEERWKDIENFIHEADDEIFQTKRKRCDSGGSDVQTSDENEEDYMEMNDDSEDDYSDIDDDITHIKPTECKSLVVTGKKQKQYFWQYNVQSKGPKGTRLNLAIESPSDPHVLNDFEDPVFDEGNTSVAGIRHGGKARKGDGNEISPNPKKLFMIGHQLLRLNDQINACQLGPDVPATKRNESRKEKNKLASRACRLKKKAQHEANKIKLYGLEQEHGQLNEVIRFVYPLIKERAKAMLAKSMANQKSFLNDSLSKKLENYSSQKLRCGSIAGKTADFVNKVILSVESGNTSGGLDIRRKRKS